MIMQQKTIRLFSVLLFLFGLSFAAGCQPDPHQEAGPGESSHITGDVRETTAPHELPSFLRDYPAEVAQTYQEVSKHHDLLAKIPCYCGCGQSVGHRNNLDCFIHQQSNDQITWDSHATTCGVCLEIAKESIQMKKSGTSDQKIRESIDQKYGNGFAEPTPTPAL
jgi:hypothetical protein